MGSEMKKIAVQVVDTTTTDSISGDMTIKCVRVGILNVVLPK